MSKKTVIYEVRFPWGTRGKQSSLRAAKSWFPRKGIKIFRITTTTNVKEIK